MIFVTVGTEYPFDRLINLIDNLVKRQIVKDSVFAQIGITNYEPKHLNWEIFLENEDFENLLEQSTIVISHGGMGTIITCLKKQKSLLVVPRQKKYGEHVNNHQLNTVIKFESMGYIQVAYEVEDIQNKIIQFNSLKTSYKLKRPDKLVSYIKNYLNI